MSKGIPSEIKKYQKCKIRLDLVDNACLKKYLGWHDKGISQRGGREIPK